MLEKNKIDKLRPADKWLLKTKFEGKYIIDLLDDKKLRTCLICDKEDIAKIGIDRNEIVTCFNQIFVILKKSLRAKLMSDDTIEIERIWKGYAIRHAYNLKEDSTIKDEYKIFLKKAYEDRNKLNISIDKKFPLSVNPMEVSVGGGIYEGSKDEISEKKKKELLRGFADMKGTRSAFT